MYPSGFTFYFSIRSGKLLSRYYNITYWPIWYIGEAPLHYCANSNPDLIYRIRLRIRIVFCFSVQNKSYLFSAVLKVTFTV